MKNNTSHILTHILSASLLLVTTTESILPSFAGDCEGQATDCYSNEFLSCTTDNIKCVYLGSAFKAVSENVCPKPTKTRFADADGCGDRFRKNPQTIECDVDDNGTCGAKFANPGCRTP